MRPVTPEVRRAIETTVREHLGSIDVSSIGVRAGEDHDGDEVLFVEVEYKLSPEPINLGVTIGLTYALRVALSASGEDRFPHVRNNFDEEQEVRMPARTRRKRARAVP